MSSAYSSPASTRPHLSRRRDKPQLSCNACRQRKRKCDRQKPCSYCIKHNQENTCAYADSSAPTSPFRQQPWSAVSPATQHRLENHGLATPSSSSSASVPSPESAALQLTRLGTGFKDSTHWSSVLNGVTGAKDDSLGTTQSEPAFEDGSSSLDQNVLLFQGCKPVTDQELLASIPPRRESDGLVSFYFRAQEYRSVIHPTEFLNIYNAFWENPTATPISWLGFLYSIFCLACQAQGRESGLLATQSNASLTAMYKIMTYREKVVQCLIKSQFAKGGPDIMETLVNYILIENYLNRDSTTEVWLLMGNIVQIAIRMGYHRDPQHFKSLSPYQGEMRRRMWALVCSLDMGFSTQMGLPSSIKHSLSDTMPPRNLQDRDFDTNSIDLPLARPSTELTSSTVIIAKLHIATNLGVVSDMVNNPHPLSYEDLIAANSKLDTTYNTLPSPCKLRPMSESLLDPPSVVFQRINFYMLYQRARILVNWKFLGTSKDTDRSNYCWTIVVEAASEIMRLQHRMVDETDVLDSFRPTGMIESCFINNGYFLAASIACFILQHRKDVLSMQTLSEVQTLLEKSLTIWNRTNDLSREAIKVVAALRHVLGYPEPPSAQSPRMDVNAAPSLPPNDAAAFSSNTMSFPGFTSFFDDLPLLMTDVDTAAVFPSLPSIPVIDYWPQVNRNSM